jgi:hypothetical protein
MIKLEFNREWGGFVTKRNVLCIIGDRRCEGTGHRAQGKKRFRDEET